VAEAASDPNCLFCSTEIRARSVAENELSYAVEPAGLALRHPHPDSPDGYVLKQQPLTSGHLIIVPYRHTPDFFSMTAHERREAEDLIRYLKGEIAVKHPEVEGFNVTTDCGLVAGHRTSHAHLHLVPRRQGDGLPGGWVAAGVG